MLFTCWTYLRICSEVCTLTISMRERWRPKKLKKIQRKLSNIVNYNNSTLSSKWPISKPCSRQISNVMNSQVPQTTSVELSHRWAICGSTMQNELNTMRDRFKHSCIACQKANWRLRVREWRGIDRMWLAMHSSGWESYLPFCERGWSNSSRQWQRQRVKENSRAWTQKAN